jgi:hypothetical protein
MKIDDSLAQVHAIARRQHGAISPVQCFTVGMTRQQVRTRVTRGEWRREPNGVLVVSGIPETWLRRAMVVTLGHGGALVLSHRAAAHVQRFDGFRDGPPIEVVSRSTHVLAVAEDVRLHRSGVLSDRDITRVRSVPTTNAAATLCMLPQVVSEALVAQALDHVLRTGSSPRWIRQTGERLRRRGLHGPNILLDLLTERVNRRLPRSWFERLAKVVFDRAGIGLEHEYPVRDSTGRILASLDLADPTCRVGVECQSWEEHGSPGRQYGDVRRRRMLRSLGWDVVDVWWWDLDRPAEVVADVLAAFERQRALASRRRANRVA